MGVGGHAEAWRRGKGRKAPRVRRGYQSTKRCLERFAPVVNDGCGGLRTLTQDRRTLVWSSCAWVAQNVCFGFHQDFVKILPAFARIWRWSLAMGRPSNRLPRVKIDPGRVKNQGLIVRGTPKSSPKAPKITNFQLFDILDLF